MLRVYYERITYTQIHVYIYSWKGSSCSSSDCTQRIGSKLYMAANSKIKLSCSFLGTLVERDIYRPYADSLYGRNLRGKPAAQPRSKCTTTHSTQAVFVCFVLWVWLVFRFSNFTCRLNFAVLTYYTILTAPWFLFRYLIALVILALFPVSNSHIELLAVLFRCIDSLHVPCSFGACISAKEYTSGQSM